MTGRSRRSRVGDRVADGYARAMLGTAHARRLVRRILGETPAIEVGLRATDAGLDEAVVQGALELALRIGESMLSLGAGAADVTAAIQRIVRAYGLRGCQVDVTFTSITVSYARGGGLPPTTLMRVVRTRTADYGRLARVMRLGREAGAAQVAVDQMAAVIEEQHSALDAIVHTHHPYPRWFVTLMLAILAAAVAVLLGGDAAVAAVAGATTALIDRVVWGLGRWGLPPFFLQSIGAAIATLVAVGLFLAVPHLPVELADLPPSLVVASGIVVLLAGLSLVGAAEDAISGFPVTAGGRTFEVVVLTLGIVVGIGAVLDVARRSGVPLELVDTPQTSAPVLVQVVASAVIAGTWAVASYARPRTAAVVAVAGGLGWLVYAVAGERGLGPAVASTAAALVIGFLAEWLGPRLQVPPLVISVCGILPLLPGLAIYRAMFQLVSTPSSAVGPGAAGLVGAAMIGLGLAAGVTLGEFLAAPLHRGTAWRRFTSTAPRRPRARA